MATSRVIYALCLLLLAGGSASITPQAVATEAPHPAVRPQVELPAGSDLSTYVIQLARTTDCAVVVSHPREDVQSRVALHLPYPDVMRPLSRQLDCFAVERPGSTALQRRYRDPSVAMEEEREEIQRAAADVAALFGPFTPALSLDDYTKTQNDWAGSISAEQRQEMETGGLPISRLRPDQRRTWLHLNSAHAFGSTVMRVQELKQALSLWERGNFCRSNRNGTTFYAYSYPDANPSGWRKISLPHWSNNSIGRSASDSSFLVQNPAAPLTFRTLDRTVCLEKNRCNLEELVRQVERATGTTLVIPRYAQNRKLFVAPLKLKANALLQGIEDLYGWKLTYQEKRRFLLDRPRKISARNAVELKQRLGTTVPPALSHLLYCDEEYSATWVQTQLQDLLRTAVATDGPDWSAIPLTKFPPEQQNRIAQIFALQTLRQLGSRWLDDTEIPGWLLYPERGVFTWEGGSALGSPGLIGFTVIAPSGKKTAWGWTPGIGSP